MTEVKTRQVKRVKSFDARVKEAILAHEKTWLGYKSSHDATCPKLKLVITFEGVDADLEPTEDRHEFTWRPNPDKTSIWQDLEKKLVLADLKRNVADDAADGLVEVLPAAPWDSSRRALEHLGVLEFEKDLIARAWIEAVPRTLNFIIIDRTLTVRPLELTWELVVDEKKAQRGLKNKFLASSKQNLVSSRFAHLEKLTRILTLEECLKLGDKARHHKKWAEAKQKERRWSNWVGLNSKEFFDNTQLTNAYEEDIQALLACGDAELLERYLDREQF